jgi:acyl carrier protein
VSAPDLDVSLRETVARQLQIPPDHLTVDRDLHTLGLGDDHTAVGVLEAVEDLLDVRFPDDFLDGVQTYGQLRSAVRIAVGS